MPRDHGSGRAALALAGAGALLAAVALAAAPPSAGEEPAVRASTFGHSARGRPLRVLELVGERAERRVLVIGCIHGNECAGRAVTRRLATQRGPAGTALWLVHDANPDGAAAGRRQNARGVDLNRNFPFAWRRLDRRGGLFWSGPRPLSEPESRALRALILRVRPHLTVWYHQRLRLVDLSGGDLAVPRRYASLVGLPVRRLARPPGSVSSWQNNVLPGSTAFVVELPAGPLSAAAAARHAAALHGLARPTRQPSAAALAALRPTILQRRIPFPARRRAETAAYAYRHYGRREWRLRAPQAIVQHVSLTATAGAVYDTFAPDRRDPELRELPGTCAHFAIARDGTIQQLVDLGTICRHAVGLNHTAIGIEHVGFSDTQVLSNGRQMAASLRLTRWLRCRYGIASRDVIGHAESLSSPYHLERIARLRRQTHGDMRRPAMAVYRARLARLRCPAVSGP
jgi:N-acetylmuramoyl-L-alanine amidase